jgi:hypothetical protein
MRDCYCGMQIKMRKSKERELKTAQMPIHPLYACFKTGVFFEKIY